ncbi:MULTISPECIES: hypothetical protein [Rhodococcus]|uniref:hypothetical protein n=1 Tax=Rhodococcus TaxID=1827 RepID=UPI00295479D7|nr:MULTISPECIES: hypothetical protein [Rhodococcus]MDV7246634.1 hypothetical protein [Rhodococcus oxybenzonivorans]MDV7337646.1 hypothetical protein [Rhodococcus oxybenzonivorans]MDV8031344.1 hypothetical protein [Rhodococcus sp. IEGM 27]
MAFDAGDRTEATAGQTVSTVDSPLLPTLKEQSAVSDALPTLGSEKGRKAMNAERRPHKVPSYRGEGLQLQLSGSVLVLVAVAGVLGALVIFGFESPLFYAVFAVAVGFGVLALSRIYIADVIMRRHAFVTRDVYNLG